mmetsp:Transcript_9399/g.13865  ORF Transcript_9399/g.13865 Transcript_9399/m.13865 type:complete len:557 (+) Transcript_9399:207-1877(+)
MGGRNGHKKGGKSKKKRGNKSSSRPRLRFKYGDRVLCSAYDGFELGTVVRLWYDTEIDEDGVFQLGKPGLVVPYQILMDDGNLVFAPEDHDGYIRQSDAPPMPIEHPTGSIVEYKEDKMGSWRRGTVIASCADWADKGTAPYTINDDDEKSCDFWGPKHFIRRAKLRFKIGDRIEMMNSGDYVPGTVVKIWPKNDNFAKGGIIVPYELMLDGGALRSALWDDDEFIRASDIPPIPVTSFGRGDRVECKEDIADEWRTGTVFQSNEDWAERVCAPFFIKFDDGKYEFFWGPSNCIRASENVNSIAAGVEELDLSDDDSLFDTPPPMPDCPICFLPLPHEDNAYTNKACCGKTICGGCEQAHWKTMGSEKTCPFCRAPGKRTVEETMALIRKRVELNDAENTFCMGCYYDNGVNGLPKDPKKAFELYLRAADLGSLRACTNVSAAYETGVGTEIDIDKARFYLEKGAKLGQVKARHNLGYLAAEGSTEAEADWELAYKHWKIAARAAFQPSLDSIADGYKQGTLSKEEYTEVLRASQKTKDEAWSKDREMAARIEGWN